jgi:chemotaxis protein methyltransferase CheR
VTRVTGAPAVAATSPSAEIDLFRELLSRTAGIEFARHRQAFLESRIRRRMRQTGARSLYEYYRLVTRRGAAAELQRLVNEVSIHETAFFRNPAQFTALENIAIPERVVARLRDQRRRLHVWSAGCATGQEPYSIAMSVFETTVVSDTWDVRITATDISTDVLRQARDGLYPAAQLAGVSADRQRRFFEKSGEGFRVRSWLRRRVEFHPANVLEGPPGLDLDVLFCRNLMIYFDARRQRELVTILARALAPGGFLFLGHTETLGGFNDDFRMVSGAKGIAYVKRG